MLLHDRDAGPGATSVLTASLFARLEAATVDHALPVGVVDLDAFDANAADLVRRAGGTPVRVASKSVRCRALIARVLARDGVHGVLGYTLPEALWLAEDVDDVVVAYPSADAVALRALAADERAAARVTVMIDSVEQLRFTADALAPLGTDAHPVRVCLDVDAALELAGGRVHLGPLRSPVRTPDHAAALARAVADHPRFALVGIMAYEGQIAGVGDNAPGSPVRRAQIRAMQRVSRAELRARRAAVVAAVRDVADLEFVNGGGTGSIESTTAEPAVTEVAAGSGLYAPTLFDTYRGFRARPSAFFALPVVRRPGPGVVTVLGGGWIASGAAGRDRLPTPMWPPGLRLTPLEGAGEVQTPVRGEAADALRVGDRVWFRHTKAGELCEHLDALALVQGEQLVGTVPTYRGEGRTFL